MTYTKQEIEEMRKFFGLAPLLDTNKMPKLKFRNLGLDEGDLPNDKINETFREKYEHECATIEERVKENAKFVVSRSSLHVNYVSKDGDWVHCVNTSEIKPGKGPSVAECSLVKGFGIERAVRVNFDSDYRFFENYETKHGLVIGKVVNYWGVFLPNGKAVLDPSDGIVMIGDKMYGVSLYTGNRKKQKPNVSKIIQVEEEK